jgi:hypothetical protein
MRTETVRRQIDKLGLVDWDFALTRSLSPFSNLHWYPCRYPSQIPATLIGSLTAPGETVLDPFLGSGTSIVEAQQLCRSSIGIELNPIAALMSRAKTIPREANAISKMIDKIKLAALQNTRRYAVPLTVQTEKWYTPRTILSLRRLKFSVEELKGDVRLIAEAAFSAILLGVCRETRHWGYVCDNTAPKMDYERDVFEEFEKALDGFTRAYSQRDEYWKLGGSLPQPIPAAQVLEGDSTRLLETIQPKSVQLIVTSPPYFGVADYVKAQRLSLEWQEKDIEVLRQQEIGARSKRRRLTAAEEYISDCALVFKRCRHVLADGRACAVIFGESANREAMREKFEEMMGECGFKIQYRASRKIATGRRLNPSLQHEHLLVFT